MHSGDPFILTRRYVHYNDNWFLSAGSVMLFFAPLHFRLGSRVDGALARTF